MEVFVRFNMKTVPVTVDRSSTVQDIRSQISENNNVNTSDIRIIFAGRELHDYQRLSELEIQNHTVVHAIQGRHVEPRAPISSGKSRYRSVPTYYVLCRRVCGSVQPGKLRIKCLLCKEDNFILTREPQGWDDLRGGGEGTCHTVGCTSTTAEFYFKCRGHSEQDHDYVLPLPLVRHNFHQASCMTCMDDSSEALLVFPCASEHVMCLDCFRSYCLTQLNTRQFVEHDSIGYTLYCPGILDACRHIPISDPHHFAIMGPENYERYKQFGAEECLLRMGGMLCPAAGCGAGIFIEPGEEGEGDALCSECEFHFCITCREPYHGTEACPSLEGQPLSLVGRSLENRFAVNLSLSRYDSETASTLLKTTKPCPLCGTPVEKSGGCMHMECPLARCRFSWCWICGTEWSIDCQDNHWFG